MSPSHTERWRTAPVENPERERDIEVLLTVRQIDELLHACRYTLQAIETEQRHDETRGIDESAVDTDFDAGLGHIHDLRDLISLLAARQDEALK